MTKNDDSAETWNHPIPLRGLKGTERVAVEIKPNERVRTALARELDIIAIRKLAFSGSLQAANSRDWLFTGKLGATVVQPCIATLEPVTTRIDEDVSRLFVAEFDEPEPGSETEMPDDVDVERLTDPIDLGVVMAEALSLALPPYPRINGDQTADLSVTEPGSTPMTDEEAKPFAGLAALRKKMSDQGE